MTVSSSHSPATTPTRRGRSGTLIPTTSPATSPSPVRHIRRHARKQKRFSPHPPTPPKPKDSHGYYHHLTSSQHLKPLPSGYHNRNKNQETITTRRKLLIELGQALDVNRVSASFWACLQVCDINKLACIVSIAQKSPEMILHLNNTCHILPRMWKTDGNGHREVGGSPSPSPPWTSWSSSYSSSYTTSENENESSKKKALTRDSNNCLITHALNPDVSYIISPPQQLPHTPIETFWDLLAIFWPAEKIELWKSRLFTIDACFNMLCLRRDVNALWRDGVFALWPLQYNVARTELEAEWYWQPLQSHRQSGEVSLRKRPGFRGGGNEANSGYSWIRSGHRVKFVTDDPRERPLPCGELLEMKGLLDGVVGMAGVEGEDEDGDSVYYDGEEGEVKEEEEEEEEFFETSVYLSEPQREQVEIWVDALPGVGEGYLR